MKAKVTALKETLSEKTEQNTGNTMYKEKREYMLSTGGSLIGQEVTSCEFFISVEVYVRVSF